MFQINYCDYNRSNPDYDEINRPKGSGDYLFLYFLTPMTVHLKNKTVVTKEGACVLYEPGQMQYYHAVHKFRNSFFHFSADDSSFVQKYGIPTGQVLYPGNGSAINELCREIYMEQLAKADFYEEQIHQLVHQLFILLSRQLHTAATTTNVQAGLYKQFEKARIEIMTHIEKNWSSESMAALTNLGTSQFYYYYHLFFNRSPKAELIDARIARAKYLLEAEGLSVNQTAFLSGFQNLSHFTRYFKKICGISPSEFARQRNTAD